MQVWLAVAAVLLFAVGGWLWVRSRSSVQTTAAVVLDLRERSVSRGDNPVVTDRSPLEIPRSAKQVVINLPIGSKEGIYDVALLGGAGIELLHAIGTARLENHVVILRVDLALDSVQPGLYFLGLRQPGLEWTRFPVRMF